MEFILNFIKGIFIGSGAILPGISSGVICMLFGLYEKLLDCILNFFKDIKNNFKFLFSIGLGIIVGIVLFSKILLFCFNVIPHQTNSIFIGLLVGSTYILAREKINDCNKSEKTSYVWFFICFLIGLGLIYLENILHVDVEYTTGNYSYLFLVLSGFLMSIGIIVPGISSTVILMLLGVYNTYLAAIPALNINILFPMLTGIVIGSFVFMKIMQYLLNKHHFQTMFGIIGFSLGSLLILFPRIFF